MVFGEISTLGKTWELQQGLLVFKTSFTGNRTVSYALIEESDKVQAVLISDDNPNAVSPVKFKQTGMKVEFHVLAKHVNLVFNNNIPANVKRIAFYGEIPDSDAYLSKTFTAEEIAKASNPNPRGRKKGQPQRQQSSKKEKETKKKPTTITTTTTAATKTKTIKEKGKLKSRSTPEFPRGTRRASPLGSIAIDNPPSVAIQGKTMIPSTIDIAVPARAGSLVKEEDQDQDQEQDTGKDL